MPVFTAHLVIGSDDSLATIPGTDEVADLAAIFIANLP